MQAGLLAWSPCYAIHRILSVPIPSRTANCLSPYHQPYKMCPHGTMHTSSEFRSHPSHCPPLQNCTGQRGMHLHFLSAGVTLVAAAHGNAALALLLTVVTNTAALFIVPFSLQLVLQTEEGVAINAADLLIKLAVTILVPLAVGKVWGGLRMQGGGVGRAGPRTEFVLEIEGGVRLVLWRAVS
jgi:hypothetical protein